MTYEGLKGLMASNIGIPSILVISFDPFCPSEAIGYSGFRGLGSGFSLTISKGRQHTSNNMAGS